MKTTYILDFDLDQEQQVESSHKDTNSAYNPQKTTTFGMNSLKFQARKMQQNIWIKDDIDKDYIYPGEEKQVIKPHTSQRVHRKKQELNPLTKSQESEKVLDLAQSTYLQQQDVDMNHGDDSMKKKKRRRNKDPVYLDKIKQKPQQIISTNIFQQQQQNSKKHTNQKQQLLEQQQNWENGQSYIQLQQKKQATQKQQSQLMENSKQQVIFLTQNNQIQKSQKEEPQMPNSQNNNPFKFKSMILKQVPTDRSLKLSIQRQGSGIFNLYPLFIVRISINNSLFMCAKKVSSSSPTFIMSLNSSSFQQNGPSYLGKVKLNFMGDICNIFGPGLNPQNAFEKKQDPRQLLATVVYLNQYFSISSKPRLMRVYVKKSSVSYFSLKGVRMFEQQKSLAQLYEQPQNRDKIYVFRNRKPVWKQQLNGYSLNFRGRVSTASIKNFILESDENEEQAEESLLFGKSDGDRFNMDVSYPLNPLLGFGIALTSFGPA